MQAGVDMKEIRVVIVDDSPFSVAMIGNILTENGFSVVGSANSMEEALETIAQTGPDLVTMDITMPGADGIECTKEIHKTNSDLKVIIVSSMMDDEIMQKAKKAGISGYIQKPVDGEELSLLIRRIMAAEELFAELENLYYPVFREALTDTCNKFFKSVPQYLEEHTLNDVKTSRGISVVIGIIGKYGGRMILDMSQETARKIASVMFKTDEPSEDHIINVIAEIANVVAGNACSMLNKSNALFGLRVAPPTVVYGESIKISKAELNTVSSAVAETLFGEVFLSVGFNRSECHE